MTISIDSDFKDKVMRFLELEKTLSEYLKSLPQLEEMLKDRKWANKYSVYLSLQKEISDYTLKGMAAVNLYKDLRQIDS